MTKFRVGVLVSGNGSNLQALLDEFSGARSRVEIAVVIANVPQCFALERAAKALVPAVLIPHGDFVERAPFEAKILDALRAHRVELVCLAGFMRVLGPTFLAAFPNRVLNIHPALLPAFPGMHAVRQALAYGVKVTGCTVHMVDGGTDTGPIVAQAAVPVEPGDDENALAARIHAEEHRLYPNVVRAFAQDRVTIEGRRVSIGTGDEN